MKRFKLKKSVEISVINKASDTMLLLNVKKKSKMKDVLSNGKLISNIVIVLCSSHHTGDK